MLHSLRLFFIWAVLCAGLRAASIDSSFSLFCEWDGQKVAVVSVTEEGRIQAMREGKLVEVPKKARWSLEGDLRSNAAFLFWSPNYSIRRRSESELIAMAGHPFYASVSAHYAPLSNKMTAWAGEGLRHSWPETKGAREILVMAWIAGGKITQVEVNGLAPTRGAVDAAFLLTREEAAGQPVLLLWADGKFSAPLTQFADMIDAEALMAAMLDDWAGLEPLVRANPKLGSKTTRGGLPLLHLAAEAGALSVVEGLVAADPKGRPRIKDSKTGPMEWAAHKGRASTVERLLEKGFDKNAKDKDTRTALLRACSGGHTEVVAVLLKAGADADIESLDKRRPISEAVDKGYIDIVQMLEPKVKIHFSDSPDNRGVLRTQAQKGHTGMVRWLLKQGISVNFDADGLSSLAMAASGGYDDTVAVLLEHKASVKWKEPKSGTTALMYAVSRGHAGSAGLLLAAGADVKAKDKQGSTALHAAAGSDEVKCAELLISAGADWSAVNTLKQTALDVALLGQSEEVAAVIAAHGGRIDVKSVELENLIEAVLRVDNATLLQRAIDDGWAPDATLQGWSALVAAKLFGAEACVKVLAAAGLTEATGPARIVRSRELDESPKALKVVLLRDPRGFDEAFEAQRVVVDGLVDAQGKLRFIQVLESPDKRLALAVLDCLKQWEFSPAMKEGNAVAVRLRFPVELPSSETRVFQITAVDEMPKPILQKPPIYPFSSRLRDQEARVLVRFVINAEGTVENIEVRERSSRECAEAAVRAVKGWKYTPAKRQGKAVAVEINLPIIFHLDG
jgi:TonB family protein